MTGEVFFTNDDLSRLGEAKSLIKALRELTAKPGNNRTVAALGEIIGLVDQRLPDLYDDLRRRLKEATA